MWRASERERVEGVLGAPKAARSLAQPAFAVPQAQQAQSGVSSVNPTPLPPPSFSLASPPLSSPPPLFSRPFSPLRFAPLAWTSWKARVSSLPALHFLSFAFPPLYSTRASCVGTPVGHVAAELPPRCFVLSVGEKRRGRNALCVWGW